MCAGAYRASNQSYLENEGREHGRHIENALNALTKLACPIYLSLLLFTRKETIIKLSTGRMMMTKLILLARKIFFTSFRCLTTMDCEEIGLRKFIEALGKFFKFKLSSETRL